MRLGLALPVGDEAAAAAAAEAAGCAAVLVEAAGGAAVPAAAAAVVRTCLVRVAFPVRLGSDHPVTLAEDVAVLDNLSSGRIVAVVDTGDLGPEEAAEDLSVLLAALTPRPVRHDGPRWRVPAGLEGHRAPDRIEVTPKPVQVEVPVWIRGAAADALDPALPRLVADRGRVDPERRVQPAVAELAGTADALDADRDAVVAWADAGATHLLVRFPDPAEGLPLLGRFLAPEVAMPEFPRVIAEADLPPPWPGPARYVTPPQEARP